MLLLCCFLYSMPSSGVYQRLTLYKHFIIIIIIIITYVIINDSVHFVRIHQSFSLWLYLLGVRDDHALFRSLLMFFCVYVISILTFCLDETVG